MSLATCLPRTLPGWPNCFRLDPHTHATNPTPAMSRIQLITLALCLATALLAILELATNHPARGSILLLLAFITGASVTRTPKS